jgi:hypothetical protein
MVAHIHQDSPVVHTAVAAEELMLYKAVAAVWAGKMTFQ